MEIEFEYFRTNNYTITQCNDVTLIQRRGSMYTKVYYDGYYWHHHNSNLATDMKSSYLFHSDTTKNTFSELLHKDNYMSVEDFKLFKRKYTIGKILNQ